MIHIQEQLTGAAVLDTSLSSAGKALSGIGVRTQLCWEAGYIPEFQNCAPKPDTRDRDKPSSCLAVATVTLTPSDVSGELLDALLITQGSL